MKDFASSYDKRKGTAYSRKIVEAVNTIIDAYNEAEERHSEPEDTRKDTVELFTEIIFGKLIDRINPRKAIQIPREYYEKRILEHYSNLGRETAFYYAYSDFLLRDEEMQDIYRSTNFTNQLRRIAEETRDENLKKALYDTIEEEHKLIGECRERIAQFS